MLRVGFIGLGAQGGPMARQVSLSEANETTLWARRAASLEPYRDTPAHFAESPAALAAVSDIVSVCVFGDADVREVVTGPKGLLEGASADTIIAVHSTVSPQLIAELAELAAAEGVHVLDAPVSGGGPAAEAGKLLVMVGGPADLYVRALPAFQPYADPILHVGPVGSGQLAKLLNNTLLTAQLGLADETVALAERLGLNRAALIEVIANGSGNSFGFGMLRRAGSVAALGDGAGPLLNKDVNLLAEAAERQGVAASELVRAGDRGLAALNHPRG
ncbi:MAG: NAD(P)-dependent oxidoreductase [Frankiales bacterium]|jgi:3-hydroxyisobutyrate dehydrogenase|nr:NAD(P)-dependent oxidoreductase [Frankiales bacterium]